MGRQEQKRSNVEVEGLASDGGINNLSTLTGENEEYMGRDAEFMAVGRGGISSD